MFLANRSNILHFMNNLGGRTFDFAYPNPGATSGRGSLPIVFNRYISPLQWPKSSQPVVPNTAGGGGLETGGIPGLTDLGGNRQSTYTQPIFSSGTGTGQGTYNTPVGGNGTGTGTGTSPGTGNTGNNSGGSSASGSGSGGSGGHSGCPCRDSFGNCVSCPTAT